MGLELISCENEDPQLTEKLSPFSSSYCASLVSVLFFSGKREKCDVRDLYSAVFQKQTGKF